MKKINLNRVNPGRSEKRKLVAGGKELVIIRARVPKETRAEISGEASGLGISESLYINAIIETRNKSKIKKIFEEE